MHSMSSLADLHGVSPEPLLTCSPGTEVLNAAAVCSFPPCSPPPSSIQQQEKRGDDQLIVVLRHSAPTFMQLQRPSHWCIQDTFAATLQLRGTCTVKRAYSACSMVLKGVRLQPLPIIRMPVSNLSSLISLHASTAPAGSSTCAVNSTNSLVGVGPA